MDKRFMEAVQARRTYYGIGKNVQVAETAIEQAVAAAVKHAPSAFNSQSARVLVLFGAQHDALWSLTKEALRNIVPADQFAATEQRIDSFGSGYGSVLYFEDQSVVGALQEKFALYKDNFPLWSLQSSGMLQFVVWTALEELGLGASLQHYNPLIDDAVRTRWNVPADWKLLAQMPFGSREAAPNEKEFQPLDGRLKVYR